MMKLNKILKDKKGAALEMAILFMVIVFCFCTLLTTMTLTARSRIKLEEAFFNIDHSEDVAEENYLMNIERVIDNGIGSEVHEGKTCFLVKDTLEVPPCVKIELVTGTGIIPGTKFMCTIEDNTSPNSIYMEVEYEIVSTVAPALTPEDEDVPYYVITKKIISLNKTS